MLAFATGLQVNAIHILQKEIGTFSRPFQTAQTLDPQLATQHEPWFTITLQKFQYLPFAAKSKTLTSLKKNPAILPKNGWDIFANTWAESSSKTWLSDNTLSSTMPPTIIDD